jgi:hypothetical protein
MHRFRFSLLALLAFTAIVAIYCAALARASDRWVVLASLVSLLWLFFVSIAAICRSGPDRTFWIAASIVGWGMFYLQDHSNHSDDLPTMTATRFVQTIVHPKRWATDTIGQPYLMNTTEIQNVQRIMFWFWPVSTGLFAGILTRIICSKRLQEKPTVEKTATPAEP